MKIKLLKILAVALVYGLLSLPLIYLISPLFATSWYVGGITTFALLNIFD